ncbi:MAG: ATP-binding protein [Candidatus Peregrinibacteria bacterium]
MVSVPPPAPPLRRLPNVRISVRTRAMVQDMIFGFSIIVLLSSIAFVMASGALQQRIFAQLSSELASRENLLERTVQGMEEQTALIANRPGVVGIAQGTANTQELDQVLEMMRSEHDPVLGIAVLNRQGIIMASTGMPPEQKPIASETTAIEPMVGTKGWESIQVRSPIREGTQGQIGTLVIFVDIVPLRTTLLDAAALGKTGEVLLGMTRGQELLLLHHRYPGSEDRPISLGNIREQERFGLPIALAVLGKSGVGSAEDYTGEEVFSAYRFLPSLGWGLEVKMDRDEAMHPVLILATLLAAVGAFITAAMCIIARALATRFTRPVVDLSRRLLRLGPGHWSVRPTIHTGDEVEILERVTVDLATRLERIYTHLEDEVKERTKELQAQYAKDRAVLENIEHGVLAVDRKGIVIDCNPAAARLLGTNSASIMGKQICDVALLYQQKKAVVRTAHPVSVVLQQHRAVRAGVNVHMSLRRSDRSLLPVSFVVTPIARGRTILGAAFVFQDTTEERRVDYIKSEFIALASHQLRTPIATLRWYLEILSGEDSLNLTAVQNDSLREMRRAADRMANLVETLLHAARLEGGSIRPRRELIHVPDLLKNLINGLRDERKDYDMMFRIDTPKTPIMLTTDPILLHVVLQNILDNAIKYSPRKGSITVRLRRAGHHVEIIVEDHGIGIPEEEQQRVFQRLFRASNASKMDTTGNGLGLFISKAIVEILRGSVTFVSRQNKGTVFTVKLPLNAPHKKV